MAVFCGASLGAPCASFLRTLETVMCGGSGLNELF